MDRALALDYECSKFIEENPDIWRQFRLLAVKLKARGIERYGAKAIWEVLRYELALKAVTTGEKYALNNNHVSRFARKLMEEEPDEFSGFFEIRQLKGGEPQSSNLTNPT